MVEAGPRHDPSQGVRRLRYTIAMLKTLSLDAGGVLVRPNWARVARVCETHGFPVELQALDRNELDVMCELDDPRQIGSTNDDDRVSVFFHRVLERSAGSGDPRQRSVAVAELKRIHDAENLWESIPEDVLPALQRLRASGLRLVVLSNANGTVRTKLERLGMLDWFEHVVDSGEEGIEKPDPRFFEIALRRACASPETTLHVGDLYHVDIVGARAAGISAVLIDRGGLQPDRGCPTFADLGQLATALERGVLQRPS